ncbi:MAG: type I-B CRISPR-associated protein Cas8b1/Cst1 [Dictyoglomaceae bacterium]
MKESIRLYPGNWLYNAGVIGFLEVITYGEGNNVVEEWLKNDGSVEIEKRVFDFKRLGNREVPFCLYYYVEFLTKDEDIENWRKRTDKKNISYEEKYKQIAEEFGDVLWGYKYVRAMNKLFYSDMPYQNLFQKGDWSENSLSNFINKIPESILKPGRICGICNNFYSSSFPYLSEKTVKRIEKFSEMYVHKLNIGSSLAEFPNSFWNNSQSLNVCPLCAYLIIHHHIALTSLSDKSEIFVNAPSFKVMWYLNRYMREVYGKEKIGRVRELLGISIIEMALRLNIQLGKWTMMNIEVVSKYKEGDNDKIDFFNLPYEAVLLLSDRDIASLLNEIGELNILDLILDGKYKEILDLAERLFKIGLKHKEDRGKQENEFINNKVKLTKNRENLISYSQKLFKLYALIEEKIRKEVYV